MAKYSTEDLTPSTQPVSNGPLPHPAPYELPGELSVHRSSPYESAGPFQTSARHDRCELGQKYGAVNRNGPTSQSLLGTCGRLTICRGTTLTSLASSTLLANVEPAPRASTVAVPRCSSTSTRNPGAFWLPCAMRNRIWV